MPILTSNESDMPTYHHSPARFPGYLGGRQIIACRARTNYCTRVC
jgi:hypothetical protein